MSGVSKTPKITSWVLGGTRVLPEFVPHVSERHARPQASYAHIGRPRSTMRSKCYTCRTPSRAAPQERIRTAQCRKLAPQGWGERACNVPQATDECTRTRHRLQAHKRRPRSKLRASPQMICVSSRASPQERVRTSQHHLLTLKGGRA